MTKTARIFRILSPALALAAALVLALGAAPAAAQSYGIGQPGQVIGNNGTSPGIGGWIPARTSLPAQNFYVNGDGSSSHNCNGSTCSAGSDSNNCRTPSTACLTVQNVINIIESSVDQANVFSTITIADGKTTNYAFNCAAPWVGSTLVKIQGNHTTPANTVIRTPTGSNAVVAQDLCILVLQDLHVADSVTNDGGTQVVVSHGSGHIDVFNVTFEGSTNGGAASVADGGGYLAFGSGSFSCNVTGSYAFFVQASSGGTWSPGQCTGSSGLTFSVAFAILGNGAIVDGVAQLTSGTSTFTGFSGITGPRCIIQGPLNIGGLNPNSVFPGNSDCVPTNAAGAIGVPSGSGAASSYGYGNANQALCSQGGGGGNPNSYCNPTAAQVNLATGGAGGVGGTLPVANGGTGQSTIAGTQASLGYSPLTVAVDGINCNATGDTTVNLSLPSTNYAVLQSAVQAATGTFTSATFGIYTAPSRGGTSLTGGQFAMTGLTTTALNTAGNAVQVTGAGSATVWNTNPLYVNVATAQGSTCTFNLYLTLAPRP